jgi:hypothetical protein
VAKWKYRKSIKIAPGIRMNLSSKGVGFSAGVPGARIGISGDRKRLTLTQSIPGTGLRKQQTISTNKLIKKTDRQGAVQTMPSDNGALLKIFSEYKGKNYKAHLCLIFINVFMIFLITIFVRDEKSPLGGVAAFNFLILLYAFPAFLIIRARAFKKARNEAELINAAASNRKLKLEFSEYAQPPISIAEKDRVTADMKEVIRLSKLSAAGTTDVSVAPEYHGDAGEVVFYKIDGSLTNFDGIKLSDQGTIYVSNQKVSFHGLRKNQEWSYKNMDVPMPLEDKAIAVFQVTNRKTVTGVAVSPSEWIRFEFFLLNSFASHKYPSKHLTQMAEALEKYLETEVI